MNDIQLAKVQRFMADSVMADAVYDVLLDSFLKERPSQDVYVLAAARLSVDFLRQGWRELEKYEIQGQEKEKKPGNVGL